MVSDFVDEHSGYLTRTEDEHEQACQANPGLKRNARQYLEYGESQEGYWNMGSRGKGTGLVKSLWYR